MSTPQHITPESAWQEFLLEQCARAPVQGVVSSIVPFGAFVRLHEGVDGLLHQSEWSAEPELGATVSVRILQLDLVNRRVSLALA